MSKEIKFRAWTGNSMIMNCMNFPEDYPIETWMQYTGLKDKNGKEIYEGDVIDEGRFLAIVHYKEGAFWLYEYDTNVDEGVFDGDIVSETQWSISVATKGEVIGNIHENPELIK